MMVRRRMNVAWLLAAMGGSGIVCVGMETRAKEPAVYASWRTFRASKDGLPDDRIRSVRVDGDRVWVGTMSGAALYAEGRWQSWGGQEGPPRAPVRSIDIDPKSGDVWLGTWGDGLYRFSAGRFDRFDQINSGLAGNLVFSVVWSHDAVWAATNGGISTYDPAREEWGLHNARRAEGSAPVATSLVCDGRNLYANTWRGRLLQWNADGANWTELPLDRPAPAMDSGAVGDLTVVAANVTSGRSFLWSVSADIVLRRDAERRWDRRSMSPAGLADEVPLALAAPSDTELWIGTTAGLNVLADWDDNVWITYHTGPHEQSGSATLMHSGKTSKTCRLPSIPPTGPIRSIAFASGGVWVGTDAGLAYGADPTPCGSLEQGSLAGDEHARSSVPAKTDTSLGLSDGTASTSPAAHLADRGDSPVHPVLPLAMPPGRDTNVDLHERGSRNLTSATIGIGLVGPRNRTIALPGELAPRARPTDRPDLPAVQLAVERANATNGNAARAVFEVITRQIGYANYGWGTKEDDFVALSSDDHVAGLLTFFDPTDETTDAVIHVTEIPVVNVAGNAAAEWERASRNPWLFACHGGEPRNHRLLIDYLLDRRGRSRVAAVSTPDRRGCGHAAWWQQQMAARGRVLSPDVVLSRDSENMEETIQSLRRASPDVILTSCDAHASAALLRAARRAGIQALFVGGSELRCGGFVESMGAEAGPVLALVAPQTIKTAESTTDFLAAHAARQPAMSGVAVDNHHALRSRDAAEHLLAAVEKAGANRIDVRRELEEMSAHLDGETHYERSHPKATLTVAWFVGDRWVEETVPPPD